MSEWKVRTDTGRTATVRWWTPDGRLVIHFDEPPRFVVSFWPDELATVGGGPLPEGFAAGLPVREYGDVT